MPNASAVIVAATRSPFGRRNGALSRVHPVDLLAQVENDAIRGIAVEPREVDLVVAGAVTKIGEQSYNVGRIAGLTAKWPVETPGITIDAQCGSSQQAVNLAAAMIQSGQADIVVASGVESMSRVPLGSDQAPASPLSDKYREQYEVVSAGESAERIAERWGVSREDCDRFAWQSHQRAIDSRAEIRSREITPIAVGVDVVEADECVRDSSLADLAGLPTVFREHGFHTAASSSPITDGASAVVLMSEAMAERRGVRPLARVMTQAIVGVDPTIRLTGPIPVTRELLRRSGLSLDDIGHFEINEAFSSIVLAWIKEFDVDPARVNPRGGAIALGHPVGATGARLVGTAAHELARGRDRYALIAMCCGGGLGTGTLLERV